MDLAFSRRLLGRAATVVLVSLLSWSLPATGCAGSDGASSSGPTDGTDTLIVSAASDLALALDEIVAVFTRETGVAVRVNLGSSGQLAQQIEAGAPVDVFFSADRQYVAELVDSGLVRPDDTSLYGLGRLAIWTRGDDALHLETLADLAGPQVERIAIANPDHAPYGRAAREVLIGAGLWEGLRDRVVLAENVLQALQFADSGNADVALVARSLCVEGQGRWVLVPATAHTPIEQTVAVISSSSHADLARRLIEFVNGPEGRPIMQAHGFLLPDEPGQGG